MVDEKGQIILNAARELFFRFGFTKTSMDDIAAQCGLAKPSLYYYYKNKEAIFDAIVVGEAEQFMNEVDKKLEENLPPAKKLASFYYSIHEKLKTFATELEEVPEMMCEYSPHGRPVVRKIRELFEGKLQLLLQEGKDKGVFHFDDQTTTVKTLTLMTQFLNLDWIRQIPETERDKIVERTVHILLNGLNGRA